MAAKNDGLTIEVKKEEKKYTGPYVKIFLQALEDDGSNGMKVDQYEHVTIANEEKEEMFLVHRGEWVDVPVPVYMVLKEKYPNI